MPINTARAAVLMPLFAVPACAVAQPDRVLFVRGADRSGGFLGGGDTARTKELSDINNMATSNGNHGWFQFAEALRDDGFVVEQVIEPLEPGAPSAGQTEGAPFPFETMDLSCYRVIVMGSNNAVYEDKQIDAIDDFVRSGGGVLFISDAGFGSDWPDAPNSDQQFLDRFGLVMQQDFGIYTLRRSDGDFLEPGHPILVGVDVINGEGVSPLVLAQEESASARSTVVVRAKPGETTRDNDSVSGEGTNRSVTPGDAALAVTYAGYGRVAGHFDRNTFFNTSGAGTDITQFDNETYAVNLIRFLAYGLCDRDADHDVDAEDLRIQHSDPIDANEDGLIDAADIEYIMHLVRRAERKDMRSPER